MTAPNVPNVPNVPTVATVPTANARGLIARSIALIVLWVAMQGELTVGNVAGGLVVVAVIEWLFPMARHARHRIHPVALAVFGARLMLDLVVSSWHVTVAVLRPDADRIHADIVDVPLRTTSSLVTSIVANAITLTPGTMTVDVIDTLDGADRADPADIEDVGQRALRVHVLGRVDAGDFREQIHALERRVIAAVTPIDPTRSGPAT